MGDENTGMRLRYVMFAAGGIAFLLLHLIAAQLPTPFLWGFDSWRYFPFYMPYILFIVGVLTFFPGIRQFLKPLLEKTGNAVSRIPLIFLVVISGVVFYLLRQKTFFLGDGQLRVRNTEIVYLFSFEEPLDTFIHSGIYKYLNPITDITGKDIYQYVSIISGMAAIGGMVYFLRKLFGNAGERWFIGCLILTCGSIQLFFGYVESYTILSTLILLFLLSSLLMLKHKAFSVIPVILLSCAVITHPLAILFIPGAFYAYKAAIHEKENRGSKLFKWVIISGIFFIILGGLLTVFRMGGHSPVQFLTHYTEGSNLLPLISRGDQYGIFSAGHFFDIVNEIGLVVPACFSLFLIVPCLPSIRRFRPAIFLFICCAGVFFFLGTFNPKLGYARDWDIFGIMAFPAALLLGVLIIQNVKADLFRVAMPVIAISFIHTLSWIGVNSSESASLERFENLAKTPYWSNYAKSMAHESIASYYYEDIDLIKSAEHYEQAYELTGNIRFFNNVIATCRKLNDINYLRRFIEKYGEVAEGHYHMGLGYLEQGKFEDAMKEFEKTRTLNPEYAGVHFQIGLVYMNMERYEEGIAEYKEALTRTHDKNILAYIHNNIGNTYIKMNMADEGIAHFFEAVKISPDLSLAHYNLANTYYMMDQYELSEKHVDLALKYGFSAQKLRKLINALSTGK